MALHVVHWSFTHDTAALDAAHPEHVTYLKDLLVQGKLVEAGPYEDQSGALLIFRVDSTDDLTELLARDPYTKAGVIGATQVYDWRPVLGPLSS
ncbi:YciI family protein [Arthrobacter sp. KK5.5]|uniref:YciI family protein n=1 Tax=Arthrobacter sp. KK5.5 TaxID=3373084 RepID=UPI003EE71954